MWSRARALVALITSAPWRRAPMLLWRRPGVLAAVAGGCVVLAASAAAVPLFLSAAGTGAVSVQARARCPRDSGAAIGQTIVVPGVPAADTLPGGTDAPEVVPADDPPDPFAGLDGLAAPDLALTMDAELVGATDGAETQVVLLARDDGVDNVERFEGTDGPGVWVSDRAASATDLAPGDTATIVVDVSPFPERGPRESRYEQVEVPVAGIYRDLAGAVPDDYWCSQAPLFEYEGLDPVPPPPVVLLDRELLIDLARSLGVRAVGGEWEARLALDDLTLEDAGELSAALEARAPGAETHLPFVAERARAIRTAVAGGVLPVAGFGIVAGAGLVGAASTLWYDRRRREVTVLAVRGAPPGAIGFKAVLELSPALVGGTAAGVALAAGLVVGLGPSPLIESWAVGGALAASAGALLVATSVVAAVVALRVRGVHGRHAARRAARVPWEVLLVGAALVSHRRLGEWGVPVSRGTDLSRVDVFGLFFPLLFLLAIVAAAARLLGLALRPLRTVSEAWPPVPFLVVRRVARYRVAVLGLVAASAVAAGVLGYAATLTRSLNATLDAKAHTFVGSDVAVTVTEDDPVPAALEGTATALEVYRGASLDTGDGLEDANLLVVDPDTFARAAFWDDSFADRSLDAVLDALSEPAEDGRLRAVVVGSDVAGSPSADVEVRRRRTSPAIGLERLPGVDEFPGMRPQQPTVVLSSIVAGDLELLDGSTEVWVHGDRDQILRVFGDAGIAYREDRTVDGVVDRVAFLTVSWTFGVLQALGVVAGVLALGGMALYLDARRRSRVLGYAFARRMGLSRAAHRRVLVAELVASVVVGCWLGLAAAVAGARLAYDRIDPVPGLPPGPLLRPALALMVALALSAFVVAVVAAVLAQRRTDRDDPLEVLRAGI